MQIKLYEHNIELTDNHKTSIEEKVSKLSDLAHKVKDESSEIKVEIEHEESRSDDHKFICKLTIFVPKDTLRAEARGETLMNAVDDAMDKISPQLERYKDKIHHISERSK